MQTVIYEIYCTYEYVLAYAHQILSYDSLLYIPYVATYSTLNIQSKDTCVMYTIIMCLYVHLSHRK